MAKFDQVEPKSFDFLKDNRESPVPPARSAFFGFRRDKHGASTVARGAGRILDSVRPRAQQCEQSCRPRLFQRIEDLKRHEPISSPGFLSRSATFTLLRPRTGAVRWGHCSNTRGVETGKKFLASAAGVPQYYFFDGGTSVRLNRFDFLR